MLFLRYLDIVILFVSLPVFLAAQLPMLGWLTGSVAWVVQRGISHYTTTRARNSTDARTIVGLMAGSMIGRGWLVAIAIFLVGLSDNSAGLAAAVLVIALFTVYFTTQMIVRPFDDTAHAGAGSRRGKNGAPGNGAPLNGGAA